MTYLGVRTATSARADLTRTVGGGAFDPNTIAGLVAWFDASDAASITSAAGRVSQWNNKKTSSTAHATQAGGAAQPATGATTQNGKNVLDFDGARFMTASGITSLNQPVTWVIVARNTSAAGTQRDLMRYRNAGSADGRVYMPTTGNVGAYAGTVFDSGVSWGTTLFRLVSVVLNSTSSKISVDKATPIVVDSGTQPVAGTQIEIGTSGGSLWVGSVAEIITFNTASDPDRVAAENYLKTKWATP